MQNQFSNFDVLHVEGADADANNWQESGHGYVPQT